MFRWAGFRFQLTDTLQVDLAGWVVLSLGVLLIAFLAWYWIWRGRHASASIKYSDLSLLRSVARSGRHKLRTFLPGMRLLAIALFFVALARPQAGIDKRDVSAEGIDIMLTLDISGSMKAEDFKPDNRLAVAKQEIKNFIDKRVNDRIGLVLFARSAFTQCPLTLDYGVLESFLERVSFGLIEDGTAIGTAIAAAVNRLRDTESKSKVIILLTDGVSNAGEIDPLTAADVAATLGVRIYAIGVGRPGNSMYPIDDPIFGKRYAYLPNEIDEETLREIARRTGGKYFRARSEEELKQIYTDIDALEKTKVTVREYVNYRELFPVFAFAGFFLLFAEIALAHTILRKIP